MFPTHQKLHIRPLIKSPQKQKEKITYQMPVVLKEIRKKNQMMRQNAMNKDVNLVPSTKINLFQDKHRQYQPSSSPTKIYQSKMMKMSPSRKLVHSPLKINVMTKQAWIGQPLHYIESKHKQTKNQIIENRVPTFIKKKQQAKIQKQIQQKIEQQLQQQRIKKQIQLQKYRQFEKVWNEQNAGKSIPKKSRKEFWQHKQVESQAGSTERDNLSTCSQLVSIQDLNFPTFAKVNKLVQRDISRENQKQITNDISYEPKKLNFLRQVRQY